MTTTKKPLPTSFILRSDGVTRVTTGTGSEDLTHEAPREEFWKLLGEVAPFSTGIMPPGVISMQHGGGFTQMVIEMPPGEYLTCWGHSEHSGHAVYRLAMPWRYFVGVFQDESLLGARVFYSPRRVTHERQALYHANVPNINCKGYGSGVSTGVGWVCLYHTSQKFPTAADKARYLIDRCSGLEPYNDANMSRTDGPRFYHGMLSAAKIKGREFLYDPQVMEDKTTKEGYAWTLDDDLWIPILVASKDDQTKHHPGGIPLTLGMVMHYPSKFYYQDPNQPKLYDVMVLGQDMEAPSKAKGVYMTNYATVGPIQSLWNALQTGFTKAMSTKKTAAVEVDLSPLEPPSETFKNIKWEASSYQVEHKKGDGKLDEKGGCTNCGDPFPPSELTQMSDTAHLKALKTVPKDNMLCDGCFADLTADAVKVITGVGVRGTKAPAKKTTLKPVAKLAKKAPAKKSVAKAAAAK